FVEDRQVDLRQPDLGHAALFDQFAHSSLVRWRPFEAVASRRELLRVLFLVDLLHDAVDPAETERFFNGVVVRNPRLVALVLIVNEPVFGLGGVMLPQPGAPLFAGRDMERFGYGHRDDSVGITGDSPLREVEAPSEPTVFNRLARTSLALPQ